jgi:hypothetical protein
MRSHGILTRRGPHYYARNSNDQFSSGHCCLVLTVNRPVHVVSPQSHSLWPVTRSRTNTGCFSTDLEKCQCLRLLRGRDLERYSARRAAGRAAYQVRAGNQPQDRQGPRPDDPAGQATLCRLPLRALLLRLRFSPGSSSADSGKGINAASSPLVYRFLFIPGKPFEIYEQQLSFMHG